jgi:hypothetical protein
MHVWIGDGHQIFRPVRVPGIAAPLYPVPSELVGKRLFAYPYIRHRLIPSLVHG